MRADACIQPNTRGGLLISVLITALLTPMSDDARLHAAEPEPPSPKSEDRAPCAAPEYRQFDFWLGPWRVETPDGSFAGTNEIRKILGGCAVQERWEGAKGLRGTSFNTYYGGRWHQTWVDGSGGLLLLDGGLEGKSMRLAGAMPSRQDATVDVHHEIRWTPLDDGRVRQLWRTSDDGGQTWTVVFEGLYAPVREPGQKDGSRPAGTE